MTEENVHSDVRKFTKKITVITLEKQKTIDTKQLKSQTRSKLENMFENLGCSIELFKKWKYSLEYTRLHR